MADLSELNPSFRKETKVKKTVADPRNLAARIRDDRKNKNLRVKCDNCDSGFYPSRYWARFCSSKCRFDWHNKRREKCARPKKDD